MVNPFYLFWLRVRLWFVAAEIQFMEHQLEGLRHDLVEWKVLRHSLQMEILHGEKI